jgi:hypothetical protein
MYVATSVYVPDEMPVIVNRPFVSVIAPYDVFCR